MSNIFMIGDTHIALGFPNSVDKWYQVHKQYFSEFLIPTLKRKVKPGDIIIHLGDLFDNRNVIPINLLNFAMDQVEEISRIAPFHIIIGNHDCWNKSSDEINTVRPFKWIPNVWIYDKTSRLSFNGLNLCLMPYIEKRLDQIKLISENRDCDYLFCHSDLNGCRMHLTSVGHKNADKIDVDDFSSFKRVFSGHIHIRQVNKNFEFIGSNFQMDRNDYDDQKGITILDTETGKTEFIPNKVSPIFKKVKIVVESDIEILESFVKSNDYIDILISNNLLVSNRKLRRKLESILQDGGFASIDYIDDIVDSETETRINEQASTDIVSLPQFQFEFKNLIEGWIKDRPYDQKVKSGILEEYKKIIRVYEESYKS